MTGINVDSPSVQSDLENLQSTMARMGSQSASCKTWCITLVSAVLAFAADKQKPDAIFIVIIPIWLFFLLDSYYLARERIFRKLYDNFVEKLHAGNARTEDVFAIAIDRRARTTLRLTGQAILSVSVWPFYILVGVMLIVTRSLDLLVG